MPITEGSLSTVGIKTGALTTNGSPYATFAECNSSGSITGAARTFPLKKQTVFSDETAQNSLTDEGGNTYNSNGARTATIQFTFMQSDVDTKAMGQLMSGKFYTIVNEETSEDVEGGTPYSIFPICKINPSFSRTNPGGEIAYTFNIQNNTTAVGVNLATMASASFRETLTGTTTVAANGLYKTILFT